ncbi:MAG: type II secretion system protein GspE, partial [Acidimicrobiia bacterium]
MAADAQHLGSMLLEAGLLTREELERAGALQADSGLPLSRVLIDEGIIEESQLVQALARQIGIEYVSLADESVDPAAAALVPESLAIRYAALPIGFEDDQL